MKRKIFFLRLAGFNVFAFLRMRVGLLRMPVTVAASAMNAGEFPFRGTESAAFGRFPAASVMVGRFCRVHGRGRICGMRRIAEMQRCRSYGEREISRRLVLSLFEEDKCYVWRYTYQVCGAPAIWGSTLSKCARGWGWGGGSLYT